MLITILTIYIIGAVVAYGLALGTSQTVTDDTESFYNSNRASSTIASLFSWVAVFAVIATVFAGGGGRLCFQWRRKG